MIIQDVILVERLEEKAVFAVNGNGPDGSRNIIPELEECYVFEESGVIYVYEDGVGYRLPEGHYNFIGYFIEDDFEGIESAIKYYKVKKSLGLKIQ